MQDLRTFVSGSRARTPVRLGLVFGLLLACSSNKDDDGGSGDGSGSASAGSSSTTAVVGTSTATGTGAATSSSSSAGGSAGSTATSEATEGSESSAEGGESTSDAATASDSGAAESSGGASSSSGGGSPIPTPTEMVDCAGRIYACGDLIDNDGDGLIDLQDPECTGPCDDDEGSFATGIPGDNVDCRQDCFFDGNSGQSERCEWDLACDPNNPGEELGCAYRPGNEDLQRCQNQAPQECIDFCAPLTPPGCDCFGCCTVDTPNGPIDIFLNGSDECSLDNLDACKTCTSKVGECGNECDPEDCELCFGETELPEGCSETTCDFGNPCHELDDCAEEEYCFLGCCYPRPS